MEQVSDHSSARMGLATVGVVFASACFGFVPVFARTLTDAGMAPHAVAFYRYVLAVSVMLPLVWRWRAQWRVLIWGAGAGAMMGVGWVSFVRAVEVVPVSTAGVIYMTYPVFTLLFSWLLFREVPKPRSILAALVIVAAAALVTTPSAVDPEHIPALLMSLGAPAGFGIGIAVLVHRMVRVPPFVRIGTVSSGSVLGLLPLILTTETAALFPADGAGWLMVLGIGFVSALIPQLIYTISSPIVGTARTAMAGSIELPVMFAIGWFFYGEALQPVHALALALVVGAILITPTRRARSVAATLRK
ncbi:DMT family transporter [Pararhodobacter oceanensis]|uniref:DMT family transporter n=1 Tax=Pararhodobacter oceanensis TaxID=2172121 RepID=UPI003A8D2B18